jgi:hypothetical protein
MDIDVEFTSWREVAWWPPFIDNLKKKLWMRVSFVRPLSRSLPSRVLLVDKSMEASLQGVILATERFWQFAKLSSVAQIPKPVADRWSPLYTLEMGIIILSHSKLTRISRWYLEQRSVASMLLSLFTGWYRTRRPLRYTETITVVLWFPISILMVPDSPTRALWQ